MSTLTEALLARRHQIPDGVILDFLELAQMLPDGKGAIPTATLKEHWQINQSAVSRRLQRMRTAGLLDYYAGGGRYRVTRMGVG